MTDAEEALAKFNEAIATFSGDAYKAYEAAIDATLKAGEEWAKAEETEKKADLHWLHFRVKNKQQKTCLMLTPILIF